MSYTDADLEKAVGQRSASPVEMDKAEDIEAEPAPDIERGRRRTIHIAPSVTMPVDAIGSPTHQPGVSFGRTLTLREQLDSKRTEGDGVHIPRDRRLSIERTHSIAPSLSIRPARADASARIVGDFRTLSIHVRAFATFSHVSR